MPITRVKPAASSSTKKAVTKKAKTANSGALPKAIAAEKDYQNVDKKVVDIKKSVNSQVLMRGAASAIKKLGANPIALIRTYSVKRGPLVFTPSGVHKKQVSSRKEGRAALNREIAKAEGFRPSELKIAQAVAARKISVNAEIIKKQYLKELKTKFSRRNGSQSPIRKSPVKPASPKKANVSKKMSPTK